MTRSEKLQYKLRLKDFGLALIGQRIAAAKEAIAQAQQAANQEEKSSAGDKYETGRAMGHLQKDMYARQLAENTKELAGLHAIHTDASYPSPAPGALIECTGLAFFMAAGLGKQDIAGKTVLFLSPQAPLAKLLLQRKVGDSFPFNGTSLTIIDIY